MSGEAWPAGGILDNEDSQPEGIFTDNESLFHGHDPSSGDDPRHVDHMDREVTRGQELSPERAIGPQGQSPAALAAPTQQLVAHFDVNGQPIVAYTEGGNRIEEWRRPTEEEWNFLRERGQIVRGGLTSGVASGAPNGAFGLGATTPSTMTPGKWTAAVIAGLAVLAGGYYAYTKYKEDEVEEEDE